MNLSQDKNTDFTVIPQLYLLNKRTKIKLFLTGDIQTAVTLTEKAGMVTNPIPRQCVGRLSADCRPTVDRLSTNCRPTHWLTRWWDRIRYHPRKSSTFKQSENQKDYKIFQQGLRVFRINLFKCNKMIGCF